VNHEKVQWLQNSLHKKLAELWVDMEATVAAVGGGSDAWIFPCQHYYHRCFGVVSDGGLGSTHCLC
jgi:hypothetical protein